MAMKRLVSGMYYRFFAFGALRRHSENWVKLQDKYECYFFAAVWHAFTDKFMENIPVLVKDMVTDWLSVGIDPKKAVIFRQSSMFEHAELSTILSNFTPLGWLERCPTFKDAVRDEDMRSGFGRS